MLSVSKKKTLLRKQIRIKKNSISSETKEKRSVEICSKIEKLEIFQNAAVIMAYWSLDDEVQTHEFIRKWYERKTILLPVITGKNLAAKSFNGIHSLVSNEIYQIPEPTGEIFHDLSKIDLVIVPGMAFDRDGNRLGRGKGYYDNFLNGLHAYKVGVCFNYQVVPSIPVEEKDISMDVVISETG